MTGTPPVRRDRILAYLDNLERQIEDIERLPVPDAAFFLVPQNFERTKAIKFSLVCAIQDVCRVSLHLAAALGYWHLKESEREAILALGEAALLPQEFAQRVAGMPGFRNRLVHDYLQGELDAARLYENLQGLDDLRMFALYVRRWIDRNAPEQEPPA